MRPSNFAIPSVRYTSKQCGTANKGKSADDPTRRTTSFNAWDAEALARMEDFTAKEFSFIVTKVNAISKSLVHRLGDHLVSGKGFSATNFTRQAYMITYIEQHRSYVDLANCRRRQREQLFPGVDYGDFRAFGELEDRLGFNGSCPSEYCLRHIWHRWFNEIPVVRV